MLGYNLAFIHKNDKLISGRRETIVCGRLYLKMKGSYRRSKQSSSLSIKKRGVS